MQTTDRHSEARRQGGQALAEFALVVPIFALLVAGIIQFGLIFWSQQTLTQVARDTGRWAATQDCDAAVAFEANEIASRSTLFGYSRSPGLSKVDVTYDIPEGAKCPPESNQDVVWVNVTLEHDVPIFFPFVPGDGHLATSAKFRMEPDPTQS